MTVWNWLVGRRDDHGWPGYIINGRIRTSTAALLVAFFVIWWVHNTYQPQPTPAPTAPQVVPPGFVPDPNFTWVPRTEVQAPRTVYRTVTPTPTTTTETSPTETTTPTSPPGGPSPTTVVDPDGPGPLPPTTVTPTTSTTTSTSTSPNETPLPVPDRSGTAAITVVPGPVSSAPLLPPA